MTTGPNYFQSPSTTFLFGADGLAGLDATGNHSCASGPVPGTDALTAPSVTRTVVFNPAGGSFNGTIVAAGCSGGTVGAGGNGGSASSKSAGADGAVQDAAAAAYTGLVGKTVGKVTLSIAKKLTPSDGAGSAQDEQQADNGAGAALAIGGAGSAGGSGGLVGVSSSAAITTQGNLSNGIFAQSVGGGGGNGGASSTDASGGNASASLSLGGSGGPGGNAGMVAVSNSGTIRTSGTQSHGIFAQSVGGGGGNGGSAVSTSSSGGKAAASFGLGGSGAGGGAAGAVAVLNTGDIGTLGANSAGIFAQSVGGGGGNGGAASSAASAAAAAKGDGKTSASTGTQSTASAPTGDSNAATAGTVPAAGSTSQPKGSGDGSDGGYAAGLSLGGAGGAGSAGAAVTVTHQGTIVTGSAVAVGAQSPAIFAQSVGGGGGNGGASSSNADAGKASVALSLGGIGAGAGAGGMVTVNATGALLTYADNSAGIFAQSVGGGGGSGGAVNTAASAGNTSSTEDNSASNGSAGSSASAASGVAVSAGLGGTGGGGGAGGAVTVSVASSISTFGTQSTALFAQSVGGGGGVSAFASAGSGVGVLNSASLGGSGGTGGNGGAVSVSSDQDIATFGMQSIGLLAQSLGGGTTVAATAGSNPFSGGVNLGGRAGVAGTGGTVTVALSGSVATTAALSPAVVAQSVGGGGGVSLTQASNVDLGAVSSGHSLGVAASDVTVTSSAAVSTTGAGSLGIVAQSIGGGGGLAYATGSATLGGGPSGANAGAVTVTSNGAITTRGINAYGILAQSVGGGGGAVISTGGAVTAHLESGSGNAAAVTVNVNAPITTTGAGAHGVVAQSVRGGGGLVLNGTTTQFLGGTSGSSGLVHVVVADKVTISATGAGASAIKTMSSTDPIVDVGRGSTLIGGSGGSAVDFEGPTNQLNNRGNLANIDGAEGLAVRTLSGDTTVSNAGTLQGNVQLAQGASNLLHNLAGGVIVAGSAIDLGGGLLRNEGVLKSGAAQGVTRISGDLRQESSGILELRVDHAGATVDTFEVSGAAQLAGKLQASFLNAGQIKPGTTDLGDFLRASGPVDVSGLTLGNTAIMTFGLRQEGSTLKLSSSADFSPQGLNSDGARLGALIGLAQSRGLTHFERPVEKLVEVPTVERLNQAYWNVSGAAASSAALAGMRLDTAFSRALLQRQNALRGATESAGQGEPDNGVWAQIYGDTSSMGLDRKQSEASLDTRGFGLAIGMDRRVAAHTTVGVAVGVGVSRFDAGDTYRGHDNLLQLGAFARQEFGPAYASAAVSYNQHRMTGKRTLQLLNAAYDSDFDAHGVTARLESGWRLNLPDGYGFTPYAAVQAQRFTTPGYDESAKYEAPGQLALNYERRSVTQLRTELGTSLDRVYALPGGRSLALRTSAAWAHAHTRNPRVETSLRNLPDDSLAASGIAPVADTALLSAFTELRLASGLAVGLQVQGEFGHRYQSGSTRATLRYQW
ncbi:autotransporter outer membrane beta-barrel domain-containing protein [Bordetella genomosp. 12]|uniref:Autotransporter domain-containing protein n=1 Tax=Bordetella genomosp. 12 TaxID=463035 RepID=A0A261VK84_9BORD|nr:autotransporter outer membrane beta-barrel domain-containing protein [Bordetella genomosp. 12]OZI74495.1 hypothetical protein CAL22_08490 [Bordetella genomosp. 12]